MPITASNLFNRLCLVRMTPGNNVHYLKLPRQESSWDDAARSHLAQEANLIGVCSASHQTLTSPRLARIQLIQLNHCFYHLQARTKSQSSSILLVQFEFPK